MHPSLISMRDPRQLGNGSSFDLFLARTPLAETSWANIRLRGIGMTTSADGAFISVFSQGTVVVLRIHDPSDAQLF